MEEIKKLVNLPITLDELINDFDEAMKLVCQTPAVHMAVTEEIMEEENHQKAAENSDKVLSLLQELPAEKAQKVLQTLVKKRKYGMHWQESISKTNVVNGKEVARYEKLLNNLRELRGQSRK